MAGIPVLTARGKGIAEAWENSLIALNREGCDIKTMYDKPSDPPSKDATMLVEIEDPFAEPMIHKDFPGGPEDLQEYTMEVVEGIKNHLVRDPSDPQDTRWEYTYNERLFAYKVPGLAKPIDAIGDPRPCVLGDRPPRRGTSARGRHALQFGPDVTEARGLRVGRHRGVRDEPRRPRPR